MPFAVFFFVYGIGLGLKCFYALKWTLCFFPSWTLDGTPELNMLKGQNFLHSNKKKTIIS